MEPFDPRDIVIWGASGHARVVADILRCAGQRVAGFLDDGAICPPGSLFCDVPVFGGREALDALRARGARRLALGVGDNRARLEFARRALELGMDVAVAVHPSAVVACDVVPGPGTVIAAGAVVNPGAAIGCAVIVNTCASVDHEDRLDDGVNICPGVRLAGRVTVGERAFVGIGAVVLEGVRIGARAVVGAGAVVLGEVPAGSVVAGVPARPLPRRGSAEPPS